MQGNKSDSNSDAIAIDKESLHSSIIKSMEKTSQLDLERIRSRCVDTRIIVAALCSLQNSKGSTAKEIYKYLTTKDVYIDEKRTRLSILAAQKKHLISNYSRHFKGKSLFHVCRLGVDDNGCPSDTCIKARPKKARKNQKDNNDACELSCGCDKKPVQFCSNGELVQFCAKKEKSNNTSNNVSCDTHSKKAKSKRTTKKCSDKNDTGEHYRWPEKMFVQFSPNGELVEFCAKPKCNTAEPKRPPCAKKSVCDKQKTKCGTSRVTKKEKNCNGAGKLCCGPDTSHVQFCAKGELVEFCAKPKCNTAKPKRSPCAKKCVSDKQKIKCGSNNNSVGTKCITRKAVTCNKKDISEASSKCNACNCNACNFLMTLQEWRERFLPPKPCIQKYLDSFW